MDPLFLTKKYTNIPLGFLSLKGIIDFYNF